jgi:prepilin-type N-terminal cleavage/methylation domain-containing protein
MTHIRKIPHRGFSLVELIVATGLFATIMTISTTAYLVMINANRSAQILSAGTNNLSYALEDMTRNIRTGTQYNCIPASPSSDFSFRDVSGITTTYRRVVSTNGGYTIVREVAGNPISLTDTMVDIQKLTFTCSGTATGSTGDELQAHVVIVVSGSIFSGLGRPPKGFDIETSATMRASDLI